MQSKHSSPENDPVTKPYWEEMRNHDYSASFSEVSRFIHQNASQVSKSHRRRKYSTWVLGSIFFPLLVIFSCQRKTYIEPQGATLTFSTTAPLNPEIEVLVRQYATKEWKAVFKPQGGKLLATITTSAEQYELLKAFSEKLKARPDVAELYLSGLKTTVKESRLSRLTYKLFNLHLDASDASDDQLRRDIVTKIKDEGQQNIQLELVKVNGKKQVRLVPSGKTHNFSLDFKLLDGTTVTALAEKW